MRQSHPVRLVLLSTGYCSLCETALDALLAMPEVAGTPLEVHDIASDDALVARYGERLPVLLVGDRELDWPFDRADLRAALA